MANCPKCGHKLKITDIKPNCPKCNVNLMNYQLEKRLDEDAANVEREIEVFSKMKKSFVGMCQSAFRLVFYVLATAVLLLPMFKMVETENAMFASGESISLLSIIMKIIVAEDKMAMLSSLFESKTMILLVVFFVGTVLLNLISLVFSVFSYTKIGTVRNIVFTSVTMALQMVFLVILVVGKSVAIQPWIVVSLLVLAEIIMLSVMVKKALEK